MENLIRNAQHIVIFTHMAPDGDAMGSSLAMYHWINDQIENRKSIIENRKSVHIIVPNAFPAFFNWMPGADTIRIYENDAQHCDRLIAEADLFVCTDFNDPKRIGPMGDKMMANPCPKILIDHHLNPVDFANEVHSYPEASSSCEIVYRIIRNNLSNQNNLSCDIATCIYTGLMTDTGNFSFNSTNCELYEMIAELVRAGIKKDEI